jgi:hypothetical protein
MRDSVVKKLLKKLQLTGDPDLTRLEIGESKSWSDQYPDVPLPESRSSILLLAAAWATHDVFPEDMPLIAADLLERGLDSPALRRLAAEMNVERWADIADLVGRMFREFNLPYPMSELHAKLIISRQVAREVIAGERDPERAADYLQITLWDWDALTTELNLLFASNNKLRRDLDDQRSDGPAKENLLDAFARLAKLTDKEIFA